VTEELDRDKLRIELGIKRRLAHAVIFKHRHLLPSPPFHNQIIDAFHSSKDKVVIEGFRDSAKSTLAEEGIVIQALLREFKNAVVIGASYQRACERLNAVKNELSINPSVEYLFGQQQGEKWGEGKIVLANGVAIQALGAGMSMRGMRHLDARPDFALIDDLEDEESVRTPEMREKTMDWLYRTFIPALAKDHRIRFLGNRLDDKAVIAEIARDPAWQHHRFPVMGQADSGVERYDLPTGKWVALWPEKFSLQEIAVKRAEYERRGMLHAFNCEYMCEADDPGARLFSEGMARTKAHVRTWQAVYAAYDPARTVGVKSAMTGVAVFSWTGSRLIVWRGDAQLWLPDQIVEDILETDDRFSPIELGVEATGLEEFIMQPLRHRALQRRQLLPLRRLVPPRGKDSFIRGLQPFFKAGEVEFVDVSAEARGQLLSFPTGRKDFPNALAYAQSMRPGLPVYDGFGNEHIAATLHRTREKWWLAVNATAQYTTAVLLQVVDGQVRVHADWIKEGSPGEVLADIVSAARLDAGQPVRVMSPALGRDHVDTVGLAVAARAAQLQPRTGGDILQGRESLRSLLTRRRRDEPLLTVAASARWTLNAFAGGYAWELDKRGQLRHAPVDGPYKVLMEGLESFVAVMGQTADQNEGEVRTAIAADGRMYKTILATAQAGPTELKVP